MRHPERSIEDAQLKDLRINVVTKQPFSAKIPRLRSGRRSLGGVMGCAAKRKFINNSR